MEEKKIDIKKSIKDWYDNKIDTDKFISDMKRFNKNNESKDDIDIATTSLPIEYPKTEINIHKIKWIFEFLKGKEVTIKELTEFFKIQNSGKDIKPNIIKEEKHYRYNIDRYTFNVELKKSEEKKLSKIVDKVYLSYF